MPRQEVLESEKIDTNSALAQALGSDTLSQDTRDELEEIEYNYYLQKKLTDVEEELAVMSQALGSELSPEQAEILKEDEARLLAEQEKLIAKGAVSARNLLEYGE